MFSSSRPVSWHRYNAVFHDAQLELFFAIPKLHHGTTLDCPLQSTYLGTPERERYVAKKSTHLGVPVNVLELHYFNHFLFWNTNSTSRFPVGRLVVHVPIFTAVLLMTFCGTNLVQCSIPMCVGRFVCVEIFRANCTYN